MSRFSKDSVCNVRPLSPDAEAGILRAFGAALDPGSLGALFDEPEPPPPPEVTLGNHDLRRMLIAVLKAASTLQRSIRTLELARMTHLDLDGLDCPHGAEAALSLALCVQDAVAAAVAAKQMARSWRTTGGYHAAPVMSQEQYEMGQRFAAKLGVDSLDGVSLSNEIGGSIPPDVRVEICAAFDEDDAPDDYDTEVVDDEELEFIPPPDDPEPIDLGDDWLSVEDGEPDDLRQGETLPTPQEIARRAAEARAMFKR